MAKKPIRRTRSILPQTSELTDELDRLGFEEAFDPEAYEKLTNKDLRPLDAGSLGLSQRVPTQPLNAEQQAAAEYARRMGAGGGGMTPEQERAAREEEQRIVSGGTTKSVAPLFSGSTPTLGGKGVVAIKPEEELYEFPEEKYTKQYDSSLKQRREFIIKSAAALASPWYRSRPEHVRKADEKLAEAYIEQEFPIMDAYEKARPEAAAFGSLVQKSYEKRLRYIEALSQQVKLIDDAVKEYGKDSPKLGEALVPQLMGMLKIYNSALADSSDALGSLEVSRIAPELSQSIFDIKNWTTPGGSGNPFKSNIEGFRRKLATLHDILISENAAGYNALAAISSPKFADRFIPKLREQTPFSGNVTTLIRDKITKKVAEGELGRAQQIQQRKALFDELVPKAELTKKQILGLPTSPEEKRKLLQQLNDDFQQRTGRPFVDASEAYSR